MYYISDDDSNSSNDNQTLSLSSDSNSDDGLSNDSIIIEFDQYSDDEEDEYTIDEIYRDEQYFLDSEKQHGHYYIGLYKHMKYQNNILLLLNAISIKTFYKYSFIHVLKYLYYYSLVRLYQPIVEIMELYILNDGTYSVVLKTHWIRLIQRHWRKALQIRKQIMKKQMLVRSLYYREIHGRFPYGLNKMPMLIGLMSQYATY